MNRRTLLTWTFVTAGMASLARASTALAYRPLTSGEKHGGGKSKKKRRKHQRG